MSRPSVQPKNAEAGLKLGSQGTGQGRDLDSNMEKGIGRDPHPSNSGVYAGDPKTFKGFRGLPMRAPPDVPIHLLPSKFRSLHRLVVCHQCASYCGLLSQDSRLHTASKDGSERQIKPFSSFLSPWLSKALSLQWKMLGKTRPRWKRQIPQTRQNQEKVLITKMA